MGACDERAHGGNLVAMLTEHVTIVITRVCVIIRIDILPLARRDVWTYVDIVYSNLTSYAITGCERKNTTVKAGDIVITSGNLNLADDTEVKVVETKE